MEVEAIRLVLPTEPSAEIGAPVALAEVGRWARRLRWGWKIHS